MLGRVNPEASGYYANYIDPWFNMFCLSAGFFVLSIFAFLAVVFLIGETKEKDLVDYFSDMARKINIVMVILGMLVFAAASADHLNLLQKFLERPIMILGVSGATLALFLLRQGLKTYHPWILRLIVGFQLGMILLVWVAMVYPNFLFYKAAPPLTIFNTLAPPASIAVLGWSLIIGALFFIPALYYLILVFKIRDPKF